MLIVESSKEYIYVIGHAGTAPKGQDILCAAITTLVRNLVESIYELTKDRPDYCLKEGFFNLKIRNLSKESNLLVDSFFIGIKSIIEIYPENIKLVRNDNKL